MNVQALVKYAQKCFFLIFMIKMHCVPRFQLIIIYTAFHFCLISSFNEIAEQTTKAMYLDQSL